MFSASPSRPGSGWSSTERRPTTETAHLATEDGAAEEKGIQGEEAATAVDRGDCRTKAEKFQR
jgi:hypothetical protein